VSHVEERREREGDRRETQTSPWGANERESCVCVCVGVRVCVFSVGVCVCVCWLVASCTKERVALKTGCTHIVENDAKQNN
jgi:hypothetical protein